MGQQVYITSKLKLRSTFQL